MQYSDSKKAVINTEHDNGNTVFLCFEFPDKTYATVETNPFNSPHTTICLWEDFKELCEGVTWHDWIEEGIKDKEFKKQYYLFRDALK